MSASDAPPRVVWSLDFELRWGVHDRVRMDHDAYRGNLEGARQAVPEMLALFTARGVRATWATVGALACESWDEYFRRAPPPPAYADPRLAFDRRYADLDKEGLLHFAPELVRRVAQTDGQDLGTHTFSHIFLGEPGVTRGDAGADHAAIVALFRERLGVTPTSLVFPRNQVAFVDLYRAGGITACRVNEAAWYHRPAGRVTRQVARVGRMADALTPWRTHGGWFADGATPSTLFVRVTLPEIAWKAHLAKIAAELRRARRGDVLHFWLHPHNVGGNVRRGIARLAQVLDAVDRRRGGGLTYASMRDLAVSGAARVQDGAAQGRPGQQPG
jgi:peptidoglycan/xylan/chitin deacetylase (PgdA/CDA1 family)